MSDIMLIRADSVGRVKDSFAAVLGELIPVLLRDVAQWSCAQVAERLDLPQGTVISRLHRGRTLLRKALDRRWAQVPTQGEGGYERQGAARAA